MKPAPEPSVCSHTIAPATVLRGDGAWREALPAVAGLASHALVLGRSQATRALRQQCLQDLAEAGINCTSFELEYDCCEADLNRIEALAAPVQLSPGTPQKPPFDAVIAIGGGKVLDAGKLLAHRLGLRCITVPTSAATCAGWTALANVYSPQGAFEGDVSLNRCPELLVFDHGFIRQAPTRTLASGIADAMAKEGRRPDLLVQVNTGDEAQKAGCPRAEADAFIRAARDDFGLPVKGLMCIPPVEGDPRPHFAYLANLAAKHGLPILSMGMSGDFEAAIAEGATHVRVGSAIFGARG